MATSASFYLAQAESCARAAAATLLTNQRDTLLRSRAAWLTLAEREIANQAARTERENARNMEQTDVR